MGKQKLFNDPIYGLINFNSELIYDLIDHPFFQRLRRIGQMGLTHLVYPGATHTRFQHAIGALYLMQTAVGKLKEKGVEISAHEQESMCAAMLLHDIGHGPISHSLEHLIVSNHHEEISLQLMKLLNREFDGKLELAIEIFEGKCERKFMHQMVSSQLDLDRMDYITRDSYYTGVAEGIIGYDRIIAMLNVVDDELVVEEKAIYSIQKFLIAREIMYKQVYLHKTSVAAEQMLRQFFKRLRELIERKELDPSSLSMSKDFENLLSKSSDVRNEDQLSSFLNLDDHDIYVLLKSARNSEDIVLLELSNRILDRKLFKTEVSNEQFDSDYIEKIRLKSMNYTHLPSQTFHWFLIQGQDKITTYSQKTDEIKFLTKNKEVLLLSDFFPKFNFLTYIQRYFLCYPA